MHNYTIVFLIASGYFCKHRAGVDLFCH